MKFNMFSLGKDTAPRFSFERGLRKLFFIFFLLLIFSQILLMNDTVRGLLVRDYELEGRPLAVNEMLFNEGKLRMQLVGLSPDNKIRVKVNGEEVASFQTSIIEVQVKDGDVLGIDCSGSIQKGEIEIVSKTPNIENNCVGKRFRTDGDPKGTLKIKVNSYDK